MILNDSNHVGKEKLTRCAPPPVWRPGEEVGGGVNPSLEGCWEGKLSNHRSPRGLVGFIFVIVMFGNVRKYVCRLVFDLEFDFQYEPNPF